MDEKHKGECRTCWLLCCALAQMCDGDALQVVDQLTGYLWDEEEAGEIKDTNTGQEAKPYPELAGSAEEHAVSILHQVRQECIANGYWHLPSMDDADILLESIPSDNHQRCGKVNRDTLRPVLKGASKGEYSDGTIQSANDPA